MKVRTVEPAERIPESEWMKMFNVSSRYQDDAYIRKANAIMESWVDKTSRYKQLIQKLKTK
jgi:hypothetical protein